MIFRFLFLLTIYSALAGCQDHNTPPKPTEKPNIIIIFPDDLGYADIGIHSDDPHLITPHIDRLAQGGAIMTNGYVTAPQCSPSRAALLSGQYQNRLGLDDNKSINSEEGRKRFHQVETLAETLNANGYATGMSGKWHLGPTEEISQHGFNQMYLAVNSRRGKWNMNLLGQDVLFGPGKVGHHLDTGPDFAASFINRFSNQPFFFYWAPRAPHRPFDAHEQYLAKIPADLPEPRRHTLAMMAAVDDGVGKIIESLEDAGLVENTLIFFISDNGAPFAMSKLDPDPQAGKWNGSLNTPFAGGKGMLSEGGIRVPYFLNWKGQIPAGTQFESPVNTLDVAATILSQAGIKNHSSGPGADLIRHIKDKNMPPPHDALFWQWRSQSAVRAGNWKLIQLEDRKYLFDLQVDPYETQNLAKSNPQIVQDLEARLKQWSKNNSPPGLDVHPLTDSARQKYIAFYDYFLPGNDKD